MREKREAYEGIDQPVERSETSIEGLRDIGSGRNKE